MKAQCSRCGQPHPKCDGHNRAGGPCNVGPPKGGTVCWRHGGRSPRAMAKAAVRAEILDWGLDAPDVDPGVTMLRLLAQSTARVARYSRLLESAYAGDPTFPAEFAGAGVAALIGRRYALAGDGDRVEIGEAIRGLADLEARERDRCMHFAKLCRDARLDERMVQLAEAQGALVLGAMHTLIDTLLARGLVAADLRGELLALSGAALRQIEGEVVG